MLNVKSEIVKVLSTANIMNEKFRNKSGRVILSSFDKFYLDISVKFSFNVIKQLGGMGRSCKETFDLKKWTVLSSPFGHKASLSQFEKKEFTKRIEVWDLRPDSFSFFEWYLKHNLPPNVTSMTEHLF